LLVKWTNDDERELIRLYSEEKLSVDTLAVRFNRRRKAVENKLRRLELNVATSKSKLTGNLDLPSDLPSLKEALKVIAGALDKSRQSGLSKIELQRLDTIANLYKAYEGGLAKYLQWSKIESKLFEMEKKYAELAKEKGSESNKASG
jgi:predicted DNA-binding protein YlxM (UPF0122 family)